MHHLYKNKFSLKNKTCSYRKRAFFYFYFYFYNNFIITTQKTITRYKTHSTIDAKNYYKIQDTFYNRRKKLLQDTRYILQ